MLDESVRSTLNSMELFARWTQLEFVAPATRGLLYNGSTPTNDHRPGHRLNVQLAGGRLVAIIMMQLHWLWATFAGRSRQLDTR